MYNSAKSEKPLKIKRDNCSFDIVATLFIFTVVTGNIYSCPIEGDIRLNGTTKYEGAVEICLNREWTAVCDDFWGSNDIRVVCRQLGFLVSGTERFSDYLVNVAPVNSGVNSVNCTGKESMLIECMGVFENNTLEECNRRATALCHEERPPQYVTLETNTTHLYVNWTTPASGVTHEVTKGYTVKCYSILNDITYGAEKSHDNMTFSSVLSINNFLHPSTCKCCVEVIFEDYSSMACDANAITDGEYSNISSAPTEIHRLTNESCIVTDEPMSQVVHDIVPLEYIIAGALGFILSILLVIQVILCICLVYMYIWKVSPAKIKLRAARSYADMVDNPLYSRASCETSFSPKTTGSSSAAVDSHADDPVYAVIDRKNKTGLNEIKVTQEYSQLRYSEPKIVKT